MKEYYVNGIKYIIYEKKTYECRYCSKDYTESEKASPHDARKFCNKKCYDKYQKGKPKGIGHFGPFILKNEKKKRIKKSDVEVDLLREIFALIGSFTLNTTKNKVIKNKLRLLDLKLDKLMSNKCIDCNKLIDKRSLRCRSCSAKQLYSEGKIMKK